MSLSKEQIMGQPEKACIEIEVPEWGGTVFIRQLAGWERDVLEMKALDQKTLKPTVNSMNGFRGLQCCYFLSDSEGNRLFPADEGFYKLAQKSAAALDRIVDAGRRYNRMDDEGVKDAEKNSVSVESADSGSGSPTNSECQSPNASGE